MHKPHNDKRGGGKRYGGAPAWKRSGSDARGFDRPELHDATCGKCGSPCQVPFRPDGSRPVYCRDCFKREDGSGPKRFEKKYGEKRPYVSTPHASKDTGGIEARLKSIEDKIDAIIEALEDDM
ncbi:hypothetical protein A2856_01950 [Candidatus Uhrbacteria bacterium RIFCSPHIGHO2_01_FULL_63_20]|uniref:CxxC-x17-CxxC domain-containing protein n=1 Tax=Candidatus Uhrbacteria bacterium RIFCSPHIGHO2_01_FULL_63_20 TaxID=1802385 RepID=A0A1F7TKE7_9BACT|nr:MAG: hypothetical protein A2856_01950 [Candidatus Uhrbacteria bacterium RIFCSPHIGHO2_01_FULL_63_20]